MDSIISIEGLNFKYQQLSVIENLNLKIKAGSITTILGNTGGGMTTLIKLLAGLLNGNGEIKVFNFSIDKIPHYIKKDIGFVIGNPYYNFVANTVYDDLIFPLENLGMKAEEIKKYVDDIIDLFKLTPVLKTNPQELSCEDASIVALASALVTKPKILILDDAFAKIGTYHKNKIFNILKSMNKKYGLTILNTTHDINDVMYGTEMILLYNGKKVMESKVSDLAKHEKKLLQYHYELPFIIDLNNKLKYYNVIDKDEYDMSKLVNVIWK